MTDLDRRAILFLAQEYEKSDCPIWRSYGESLRTRVPPECTPADFAVRAIAAALRSAQPIGDRACWRFVGPTGTGRWHDISVEPVGSITKDTKIEYAYRDAQPAGDAVREMLRKLAVHVRPTCPKLYDEAMGALAAPAQPIATVPAGHPTSVVQWLGPMPPPGTLLYAGPAPAQPVVDEWPQGAPCREKTLKVLREHNAWRRGGDGEQTDPRVLGLALDAVIAFLTSQPAEKGVEG